jgi:hypothetical protein
MKSLFDTSSFNEVIQRINALTPDSQRQWGKMEVAQMMAHCKEAFKVPLSERPIPRMFISYIIGWAIKSKLYNETPYGKGLPTSPDFLIKDQRNFEQEKHGLIALITNFYQLGSDKVAKHPHPFFGKLTPVQWGQGMYKHLDHHLSQFGA